VAKARIAVAAMRTNAPRTGYTGADRTGHVILEFLFIRRARDASPAQNSRSIASCLFAKYGISVTRI
jgi:hypothetical protein